MKFLPILKKQINESLVMELSNKMTQKLIQKFQKETKDDVETIASYINDFEKYKKGLSAEERNIEKYGYNELKDVINPKRLKNKITKYTKYLKTTTKGYNPRDLEILIRKFLELEKFMSPKDRDITKFNYLELHDFMEKNFEKAMKVVLTDKLSKETQLTPGQIDGYVEGYLNVFDEIPLDTKLAVDMNWDEFEGLVNQLTKTEDGPNSTNDLKDIELLYDENNLKIFAPKTKDQCILLRNGRSWCTSRDGSGNLYYNYRLNNNLTLYYVINEDLPFSHVNFASVILVQRDGRVKLADGTNSGRFSGHETVSWDQIYEKIPKLRGLESIFKPKPLTDEEKETINKVQNTRVGDNPMESFKGDEKLVELWLEIKSPNLSDTQYLNIPDDLQKKYIALGFSLTPGMINSSSPEVTKYYTARKIETIKGKGINDLSASDIALLNTPGLAKIKSSLKDKFVGSLTNNGKKLDVDGFENGPVGKFIALYGLDELMGSLPDTLEEFKIKSKPESSFIIRIPESISKFKRLNMLLLDNCIESVPESICGLSNLRFLSLMNNENLQSLPECIGDMDPKTNKPINLPNLLFINLKGSNNVKVPASIANRGADMGNGYWDMDSDD